MFDALGNLVLGRTASVAGKVSNFNRRRKWQTFIEVIKPTPELRVLDVGYTEKEYSANENFIEKHYPYPHRLTALGLEDPAALSTRYPQVDFVRYEGAAFPFEDKSFDVCWSNAVIEHVGGRDDQLRFLKEIKRVSKRGFVTTPNRYFPIEVHTRTPLLHWLPKPVFDSYLRRVGLGWASGSHLNLLSLGDVKRLLRDADITDFRIIKNRLFRFPLDFVMIMSFRD